MLTPCRIAFGADVAEPARVARDEQPVSARPIFSGISAKLMSRMGYKEGDSPALLVPKVINIQHAIVQPLLLQHP